MKSQVAVAMGSNAFSKDQKEEKELASNRTTEEHELGLMPADYRHRVSPDRTRRHIHLISSHPGYPFKDFIRTPLSFELEQGSISHRLTTFSLNSPRALVHATAAIAANGGSIQSADLFPRSDGTLIMDTEFALPPGISSDSLGETLQRYFSSHEPPPRPKGCEPVRDLGITHHLSGSRQETVIEIKALDSRGLLYRIASAFSILGIKVLRADIRTVAGRVHDVFHTVDRLRRPLNLDQDMKFLVREIESNIP
ncbi:MAG: hypothetical protein AB1405_18630 [Bdellovibrionota bacterium]